MAMPSRPLSSCLRPLRYRSQLRTSKGGKGQRRMRRGLRSAPKASLMRTWSRVARRAATGQHGLGNLARTIQTLRQAAQEASLDEQARPTEGRLARSASGGVIAAVQQRGGTRGSGDEIGELEDAKGRRQRAVYRQLPPLSFPVAPVPTSQQQEPMPMGRSSRNARRRRRHQASSSGSTRLRGGCSSAGGDTQGRRAGIRASSASGAARGRAGWARLSHTCVSYSTCFGGRGS